MTAVAPPLSKPASTKEGRASARRARRRRRWLVVTVALVAFGAVLRVAQYASRQSFWADEAALLFNLTDKSTRQLVAGPLDHGQAAPPGFLAIQRAIALTLGTGEYAQRLIPLLFGIASLPLAARLAWRWLPPAGATFAVALLALADTLVWQSATLKPYTLDLFVALALLLIYPPPPSPAGGGHETDDNHAMGRLRLSSCAAAVAVWFSLVASILFAGLAGAELVDVLRRQRRARAARGTSSDVTGAAARFDNDRRASSTLAALTRWALTLVPFAVSFAALYAVSIRHQSGNTYLQSFWTTTFPDYAHPSTLPRWFVKGLWGLAGYVGWPAQGMGAILIPLAMVGFVSLKRQGRLHVAIAMLAPIVAALAAALVHQYPWTGRRVTIFLLPAIVMLAGAGVGGLAMLPQRWPKWVAAAGLVPVAILLAVDVVALARPRTSTHLRPVLEYVRARRAAGEPLYVSEPTYAFDWYWPDAPEPLAFAPPDPDALPPGTRLWYVVLPEDLEHPHKPLPGVDALRARAREVDRFVVRGGAAYQFEALPGNDDGASSAAARTPPSE